MGTKDDFRGVGYWNETLVASAARTTTGNTGNIFGYGAATSLRVLLDVSAASGTTPSLTVLVEDSFDGGTNWNTIGTFAAKTAVSREALNITTPLSELIRVSWTITGTTPSFTFSVNTIARTR